MKQPPRGSAPAKHVILFLAANPSDTGRLALDREARAIHVEIKRSGYRDRFEFVTRWATEPLDLLRELREMKPTIVHFSGHGAPPFAASELAQGRDVLATAASSGAEPGGVVFDSATGASRVVTPEAIAQTFGAVDAPVRLVLLNACYTGPLAEALLAHVDCVVGMSGSIHDDAARSFAVGFYGGLGEHESIAAAFQQGKAAINLEGLPDVEQPQLKVRASFDADQLILAAAPPLLRMDLPCPYPGMRPYTTDEAAGFHGREAEIDELIGRLRAGEHEIYVIGPSGSGKSSLVSAGVLPRLARGVVGLGSYVVRSLRPGEQPAARLYEALDMPPGKPFVAADCIGARLAHRAHDTSMLLVVDQLEELFTLATVSERDAFLAALRELRGERRFVVIVTLRADFLGALMESSLWPEKARDQLSLVKVGPLRGQLLREVIVSPAHTAGVEVEPELVERLIADTGSEPGILPLLQETMIQLWDKRADQTLTLANYQALGDGDRSGLAVAVARRADATLRAFTDAQTEIARRILLRLISFGEGRSDTRRQQPRAELCATGEDAADFAFVLQSMVDDRLLTVDEDVAGEPQVDLAHEILISAWPRLADWIRSHRVDEQRRRGLETAAAEWAEHGRSARGLLDSIELADAEMWQQTESAVQLGQSTTVMALIAASRAVQTRQRRRRRLLAGVVGVLGAAAVAVGAAFLAAHDQADQARRLANRNRELVAQSYAEAGRQLLIDHRFQEAVPYLLAARQHGDDRAPLRMMFWEAKRHLPLIPTLEHPAEVSSSAFSPDGTRVVTASRDHTARVWDAVTGKLVTGPLEHQDAVVSAAFSPDGMRVVTASRDHTARVWNAVTGKLVTGPLEHQDAVVSAAFSPDGMRVVTASWDHTVQVWDAVTGKVVTGPLVHRDEVVSAAFSPDGTRVVTASRDHTAQVWDAVTGKVVTGPLVHRDEVVSAAFSPDGTRVVTASWDHTARVWDTMTGKLVTSPLEHQDVVVSAAFSPDGTRVVTASRDHTARVWDATTGKPLTNPLVHQDAVVNAAFNPNGTRVVTASHDHTAQVWDAAIGTPFARPFTHQGRVVNAAFSPDGTRVVTASWDGTARVWDAAISKSLGISLAHQDVVRYAAFSPDGTRVVTASDDWTARVWDAATGTPLTSPLVHQDGLRYAVFSPDGTRVVTASLDKTARVWEVATGTPIGSPLVHQAAVVRAAFSPDGTRVVTASGDKTAQVWEVATGKPIGSPLVHQAAVVRAAFSPDGTRVVTASWDKTARVWEAATGKLLASPLVHQDEVWSAAFSPDSTRVVTASLDKTARVWDASTGKLLTSPLEHQGMVWSAAFSPDGARVVTASEDKTARLWDMATGKLLTSPLEHQEQVVSAAFSPDGMRVVTASLDKTARVWDAITGKPLTSPLEHQAPVVSVAFSPDGTRVVTASSDKTARVWDVRPDMGSLDEWSAVAERSPFVLSSGVLVRHSLPRAQKPVAKSSAPPMATALSVKPAESPLVPASPWPDLNLGFEQVAGERPSGWIYDTSYMWSVVTDIRHGGEYALRLQSAGMSKFGAVIASAPAEPVRGKHLKLRGWIKTDKVTGSAAMFLRVDGGGGAFDNMGARTLSGTADWAEAAVEVDVPDQGETVVFGPLLIGEGTAWFDDLRFEVTELPRPHPIVLEGTVVDAGGAPVSGAEVALVRAVVQQHVRSDAAGKFHFDAVSGKWGLSASHSGAVGAFLDSALFDGDARSIRLALGASDGVVVHGKLGPGKLPPGGYAAVSIVSSHGGDSFAVPVAEDGTFEVTLPRGDEYTARIIEGGNGVGSGKRTGDRVEIAIPLAVLAPPPQEVVDWIAGHAIVLSTTEAGHGLDDIAPIAKVIGKARIVGLGDATLGTREIFQLKHRVLEYLVAKQGFTVFAIEANQPECRAINDYVLHGTGDPRAGLAGIYFWTWNTEEVLTMIEWMRAWNADPAHRNKVQFLGFDMQTSRVAHTNVAAYLAKVAPNAAASLMAPIEVLGGAQSRSSVAKLSTEERKRVLDGLAALGKAFDANRKAWLRTSTMAELDEMRQDLTILEQANELYSIEGGSSDNIRNKSMAANIRWILDHQPAGTRMVIWSHNAHIANRRASLENMGGHLRRRFKADYVNLGFVFSQGSFQAFQAIERKGLSDGLNEITLGDPPESNASVAFARTSKPLLVLDLRALPKQGIVRDWFVAPHPLREIGAVFSSEQFMTVVEVLPELYDTVIFVDKTTRARPNHPR